MRRAQIKPLVLEAKEAVSLINGTQAMLAVGILALLAAEILADTADVIGALSLDALRGTDVAFDERIHKARPHPGQLRTAANLRKMLEGSSLRESHRRLRPRAGCLLSALHAAGPRRGARHARSLPRGV